VHSAEEAARACAAGGLDYLLFGTVFETASKPGQAAAGVDRLVDVVAAAKTVPVLAVGGITTRTAGLLPGTGCAGFAAIGLFADAPEASLSQIVADALAPWENRS
jgi:thiamine monophosphate synthase